MSPPVWFSCYYHLLFTCLCFFLINCDAFSSTEVYALYSFKERIYEDPLMALHNWDSVNTDPCNWSGVSCSVTHDRVFKLNISGSLLKGFLAPELGLLSSLKKLILNGNKLTGSIPKEIGGLKYLRVLDLGMNQFMGSIPSELGSLRRLVKLNLESNQLTGMLPKELSQLKHLKELQLGRNMFVGSVLDGKNITLFQLKTADFSYNFFNGSIPKCFDYLPRSSFQGNCFQIKDIVQRPLIQCGVPISSIENEDVYISSSSRPKWLLVLEIVTATIVSFVFFVAILRTVRGCRSKSSVVVIPWKKPTSDCEILKDVKRFSRQELEDACEEFSNIIGSSSESIVYKGTMKGTLEEIAVVSVSIEDDQWTGFRELCFQREVADLARLDHENVGKLIGYCREIDTSFSRMLVFEYASNGTLYEYLHCGDGCQLSWSRRMKIVLGIARGLKYLHGEIDPPFAISDLNSNVVYLTDDFSPKLVDFENWKSIVSTSEKKKKSSSRFSGIVSNSLETRRRHVGVNENVYSFGSLLLEIISGRHQYCPVKGLLVDWASEFLEMPEVMSYVVDPEVKHFRYEDVEVICEVVSLCIHRSRMVSMEKICEMLESRIVVNSTKNSPLAWAELAVLSN
ncbi:probable LRR receptor-like serine/threonine-protein kinase At1g63430 [Impatiens glandulifera]|uniref:probable LRR receptor-like serine/threonine-protein kinase At1g63430 n=1 Tax=Impatiens glandulifera TaxID=253017 RepID=UPI001FB18BD5|nr:probable LRR receptor-like serine/threonine-protein kinase At1g63430 [Impatiens glandulifera]